MRIPSYEEQQARYERQKWEHEHPFRMLAEEVLEVLPLIYLLFGWLSFFLLFASNRIVFYAGVGALSVWFVEMAYVAGGTD